MISYYLRLTTRYSIPFAFQGSALLSAWLGSFAAHGLMCTLRDSPALTPRRPLKSFGYILPSIIIMITGLLSSCMVGPTFHSPLDKPLMTPQPLHAPLKWPLPKHTTGHHQQTVVASLPTPAQTILLGQDLTSEWWHLLHSPTLNRLIKLGLRYNPDLASAKAALTEAQFNLTAQIGSALLPAVTGNASATRQRLLNSLDPTSNQSFLFNLFNAGVSVSYTIDLFGGLRRQVESSRAQVQATLFQLEAAYLTLTANIITTSLTAASLTAQIKAMHQLIKAEEKQLAIIKKRYEMGGDSKATVLLQAATLAQNRAALPPLQQQLAMMQHLLALLTGQAPTEQKAMLVSLEKLTLPSYLPLSIPAKLVRQRPDIRAAEALLHQSSANIGVATANLYPSITLNASNGWQSTTWPSLFRNRIWSLGPLALNVPLFQGGALIALRQAAIARYQQAAAHYQQTVLQAFQNVADTLRAIQYDAKSLLFKQQAMQYADASLILARAQYQAGGVSYLTVLTAEVAYQQAYLDKIKALAARYTDTVALLTALGGGWWHRAPIACHPLLLRNSLHYLPDHFPER